MEANENENTIVKSLWGAAKEVIRENYIAIKSYLKKQENSQTRDLNLHPEELEKE